MSHTWVCVICNFECLQKSPDDTESIKIIDEHISTHGKQL